MLQQNLIIGLFGKVNFSQIFHPPHFTVLSLSVCL